MPSASNVATWGTSRDTAKDPRSSTGSRAVMPSRYEGTKEVRPTGRTVARDTRRQIGEGRVRRDNVDVIQVWNEILMNTRIVDGEKGEGTTEANLNSHQARTTRRREG